MKKAFSMIELILAIVIVAIAISALPRIVSTTKKSNEFALKQELIFHAKTMLSYIEKFPWDSNAYEEECTNNGEKTGCGNTNNMQLPIYPIPDIASDNRPGIIPTDTVTSGSVAYSDRRPTSDYSATEKSEFTSISYGTYELNGTKLNDIDDFDGYTITDLKELSPNKADFVISADLNVSIGYVKPVFKNKNGYSDENLILNLSNAFNGGDPTDIKMIKVNVKDDNSNYHTSVVGYAFNIGQSLKVPVKSK